MMRIGIIIIMSTGTADGDIATLTSRAHVKCDISSQWYSISVVVSLSRSKASTSL